mmetsp:Transcript_20352/g.20475  ORF Transcript_20352/g.20475 Transcript_20352/m.20475 type:complete len:194 (+) Transcript_20352:369-950(+)
MNEFLKYFYEVDNRCHCSLSNTISRRASISQGKCFLRIVLEAYPSHYATLSALAAMIDAGEYDSHARKRTVYGHYSPVFGVICGILGFSSDVAERLFMRCVVRDLTAAAVRLNIIGPIQAARTQSEFASMIEKMFCDDSYVQQSITTDEEGKDMFEGDDHQLAHRRFNPFQTSPILDLLQSRHDQLYSRLFNS